MEQKFNYKWVAILVCLLVFIGATHLLRRGQRTLTRAQYTMDKLAQDKKIAMDSIVVLNHANDSLVQSIAIYKDSLEALSKYKSKVIIKYRDQKNFVSDASIHQLDSIIRANTKIGK